MNIWCPACGCDVSRQLTPELRAAAVAARTARREISKAVSHARACITAMEVYATEKGHVMRPIDDIYREWSSAILDELRARFPEEPVIGRAVKSKARG